jgi:large subunit ribosomal protein L23
MAEMETHSAIHHVINWVFSHWASLEPQILMQSLSLSFRRLYATQQPLPPGALAARTASTPLAVRLRRRKKIGPIEQGQSDATLQGLTPSELARFQRLRAKGQLGEGGEELTEGEWLEKLNEKRSRVRGFKTVKRGDGEEETQVVGQRVYLPNIIFRLVRNFTPAGQPYNPYEATFRIPKSITKTDVRSYLLAVYGVKTTYIRTDNYISPHFPKYGNQRKNFKTYKRAVVGLVDPFYYPLRLEDMESKAREEREKWIEDKFSIEATRWMQKYELLRMTKGGTKGWKWSLPIATKRSHILRLIAERREKREGLILQQATEWQRMRERGEEIVIHRAKGSTVAPDSLNDTVPSPAGDSSSPTTSN